MFQNPWKVDSVQAFSCLKCPECNFFTKEEKIFKDHAMKKHPLSLTLFVKSEIATLQVVENCKTEQLNSFKPLITIKEESDETNIYVKESKNEQLEHRNQQIIFEHDPLNISKEIASTFIEENETFVCSICSKTLTSKYCLNQHIVTVHRGHMLPLKPFKCDICGLSFAGKLQLKGHIASVHEGKKRYACSNCEKSFSSKYQLNGHMSSTFHRKLKLKSEQIKKASVETTSFVDSS